MQSILKISSKGVVNLKNHNYGFSCDMQINNYLDYEIPFSIKSLILYNCNKRL